MFWTKIEAIGMLIIGVLLIGGIVMPGLVADGMEVGTASRVIGHCNTDTYCYTIKETTLNFNLGQHHKKKYTLEFRGGNPEQRGNAKTTPFYSKESTYNLIEAQCILENNIRIWEGIRSKQ